MKVKVNQNSGCFDTKAVSAAAILCFAFIITAIMPTTAAAHSIFIQSGRHQVSDGKSSPLFFCYGHHFPVDDAVRQKKISYVRVIAPDQSSTEIALRNDRSLHSYLVEYNQTGTYTLTAETNPGYFAMYIDKKGRKRHSLKPISAFADNATEIISSMKSHQWAKTYVFCDKPSDIFPARVNLPMELVPTTDVSRIKQGDKVDFLVYNNGSLFGGIGYWDATYSGFSTEAEDMYIQRTPCEKGKFTVPVDVTGR